MIQFPCNSTYGVLFGTFVYYTFYVNIACRKLIQNVNSNCTNKGSVHPYYINIYENAGPIEQTVAC